MIRTVKQELAKLGIVVYRKRIELLPCDWVLGGPGH